MLCIPLNLRENNCRFSKLCKSGGGKQYNKVPQSILLESSPSASLRIQQNHPNITQIPTTWSTIQLPSHWSFHQHLAKVTRWAHFMTSAWPWLQGFPISWNISSAACPMFPSNSNKQVKVPGSGWKTTFCNKSQAYHFTIISIYYTGDF